MTIRVPRWAVSPYDGACHALDPEHAALVPSLGYAEALCEHTMPGAGLKITDAPSGRLCVPCAVAAAEQLPDPGRFGRFT